MPPHTTSTNRVEEANETGSTSFRKIQLSLSGQENEVQNYQGPTLSRARMPVDTTRSQGKYPMDPPFPPIEDQYSRRSIRVSPFEPMAHLRRMPRNGTISPLRIHEYQAEMQTSGNHVIHEQSPSSRCSSNMRPPLDEVRIPGPSASFDGTLSSAVSPSRDYKALYLQSQRELESLQKQYRALQKLQERTLGESHFWRSKIKTLMKRHKQEGEVSGLSGHTTTSRNAVQPTMQSSMGAQPGASQSRHEPLYASERAGFPIFVNGSGASTLKKEGVRDGRITVDRDLLAVSK